MAFTSLALTPILAAILDSCLFFVFVRSIQLIRRADFRKDDNMFILKKDRPTNSAEEWASGWQRYQTYLKEIDDCLPSAAREFATAAWHYNHMDHRAPHDAWVERIEFQEVPDGKGKKNRRLQLRVLLLGAYHDGHIELLYRGVKRYSIASSAMQHGDWLYDEIRLADGGCLLHEVELENGEWRIECEDVEYVWHPLE